MTATPKSIVRSETGRTEQHFVKKTREILDGFLNHMDQIETILKKIIPEKHYQLIITNISSIVHEPQREYGLILDAENIIYAEKSHKRVTRYQFCTKTFSLQYNDKPTRIDALSELIKRIQSVLTDLESHQAIVYEYRTHLNA